MLNKIITNIEKVTFLTLRNLDIIYLSLYDFFNQHYTLKKLVFDFEFFHFENLFFLLVLVI